MQGRKVKELKGNKAEDVIVDYIGEFDKERLVMA